MRTSTIVLAGSTGNLGQRIARALAERGATVRALVRRGVGPAVFTRVRELGATPVEVDYRRGADLAGACEGADCVVSALAGLRDVVLGAQTALLEAAVDAGVPRFVPSDFSIDFTKLPAGRNRNLDLRREFHAALERAPLAATSIFTGAFAELLTGPAPLVLFGLRAVVYWRDADQPMDFTAVGDAAAFTARAALDPGTPRFLRVAGDVASARDLARLASEVTGKRFRLVRAGDLDRLSALIRLARFAAPQPTEVYPPWQGMMYLRDMFDGRGKLEPLDNMRYPDLAWTGVRAVLASR